VVLKHVRNTPRTRSSRAVLDARTRRRGRSRSRCSAGSRWARRSNWRNGTSDVLDRFLGQVVVDAEDLMLVKCSRSPHRAPGGRQIRSERLFENDPHPAGAGAVFRGQPGLPDMAGGRPVTTPAAVQVEDAVAGRGVRGLPARPACREVDEDWAPGSPANGSKAGAQVRPAGEAPPPPVGSPPPFDCETLRRTTACGAAEDQEGFRQPAER